MGKNRKIAECIECHSVKPIHGLGLCENCYRRKQYRKRIDIEQQRARDRHQQHRDEFVAKMRERYSRNKERMRDAIYARRLEHPEKFKEQQRTYRQKYPERIRQRNRNYAHKNRDRVRVLGRLSRQRWIAHKSREEMLEFWRYHSQIRAARKRALNATLTRPEWEAIKDGFNHCCVYCNRCMHRLTQDHIVPMSKGGTYTADNIVPACASCNSRKHARDYVEFLCNG